MATVYFVREGTGERATDAGREVAVADITNAFKNVKVIWSQNAPIFGSPKPANAVSDYRYVVVHVKDDETNSQFNKAGYWQLVGITPSRFAQFLERK